MNPPAAPKDGESPWRKATTRKPLTSYPASPEKETPEKKIGGGQFKVSPPNSDHKNSTRINESQQDMAASPALFRMEDTQANTSSRVTRNTSYTKIKDRSGLEKSLNNSSRHSTRLMSSSELFNDDDQPSAKTHYVGGNTSHASTINNSRNTTSKRNITLDNNNSVAGNKTQNILNVSPPTPASKSSSSCCKMISGLVLGAALIALVAIVHETGVAGVKQSVLKHISGSSSDKLDSAEHWQMVRRHFSRDLGQLRKQFPSQSNNTWRMIGATLKSPMQTLPDYPGVLLILSPESAVTAAECLTSQLLATSSSALSSPGTLSPGSLILRSETYDHLDPDTAKQLLTDSLHHSLSSWRAAGITHLDKLHPTAALTLHAFADNSNAPYKQAVMIFTITGAEEEVAEEDCNLETKVEKILGRVWESELGRDKLSALLSRVVVSVAVVRGEESLPDYCP